MELASAGTCRRLSCAADVCERFLFRERKYAPVPRVTRWIFMAATAVFPAAAGLEEGACGCAMGVVGPVDSAGPGGWAISARVESAGRVSGSPMDSSMRFILSAFTEDSGWGGGFRKNESARVNDETMACVGDFVRFILFAGESKNRPHCSANKSIRPANRARAAKVNTMEMSKAVIKFMSPCRRVSWVLGLNVV